MAETIPLFCTPVTNDLLGPISYTRSERNRYERGINRMMSWMFWNVVWSILFIFSAFIGALALRAIQLAKGGNKSFSVSYSHPTKTSPAGTIQVVHSSERRDEKEMVYPIGQALETGLKMAREVLGPNEDISTVKVVYSKRAADTLKDIDIYRR